MGQSNQESKETSVNCESNVEKLDLGFLQNKTETFLISVTHLILRFTIVQNNFQQAIKTKINHINENHIKIEVSLHFWGIWPTVRRTILQAKAAKAVYYLELFPKEKKSCGRVFE